MTPQDPPRAKRYVPRVAVEAEILEGALSGDSPVQVIEAPRGAGKSALLAQVASRLAGRGAIPALVDFDRICTTPGEFAIGLVARVEAAAEAASGAGTLPRSTAWCLSVRQEAGRRRPDPVRLLDLALASPGVVAEETGRRVVLLADEAAEISRLTRHSGLRDGLRLVARRLAGGPFITIASVSPGSRPGTLIDRLKDAAGERLRRIELPPFDEVELDSLLRQRGISAGGGLDFWMIATAGRPLYVEILARRVEAGEDLASALAAGLTPPLGAMHQECRFDYHLLVERSRGHAAVRAILQILSREEGATLSRVAERLGVALPTALDYLSWLMEVGLIRRDGPGYVVSDPLLALWVRLNGPDPPDLMEEVAAFLRRPRRAPRPPARPRGRRPGTAPPAPARRRPYVPELRIEID